MLIALCDDENAALNLLKAHINTYCSKENFEVEFDCFSCGEDFLSSPQAYDIVFMDIYLPGISGTDAVREGSTQKHYQTVFTTTSREHAVEAFGLNATHYLVKPLTVENISEAMARCLTRLNALPDKILEIKTTNGLVPITMTNVTHVEVFNKISIIHTQKCDYQTYTSLDTLFEMLDNDCFLKLQRSYVVNMNFIESFLADHVVLQNGVEIVLSRNNRQELKNKYQRFLFDLARRGKQ